MDAQECQIPNTAPLVALVTVSNKELEHKFSNLQDSLGQALEAVRALGSPGKILSIGGNADDMTSVFQQLPEEVVDRLKAAVEMGDVMQVQSIAKELKSTNDAVAPFCNKLIQLAEDFDFDGMQAFMNDVNSK